MRIGFDAKRAFHNETGLGNYSRVLIDAMAHDFPEHNYYLFNPKKSDRYSISGENLKEQLPEKLLHKKFSSLWRSKWITRDIERLKIDVYHGLSHELPFGIRSAGCRSVVTIHDLIPERFPGHNNPIDTFLYTRKTRYACRHADKIIYVSRQTQLDVIDLYGIPPSNTVVCYPSCYSIFGNAIAATERKKVLKRYGLPERFFLSVGSIIERKNLLNTCKALWQLGKKMDIPLVVIGKGKEYLDTIKRFLHLHHVEDKVIFLSEQRSVRSQTEHQFNLDFPALYQSATAMIYPSYFEGFGLPVLEAQLSGLPVITSSRSSLPEAAGDAALFVDPDNPEEIAEAMKELYFCPEKASLLSAKGKEHAALFSNRACAEKVMAVYRELC